MRTEERVRADRRDAGARAGARRRARALQERALERITARALEVSDLQDKHVEQVSELRLRIPELDRGRARAS